MLNWFEVQKLHCSFCKHIWIIQSDKVITDDQYNNWVKELKQEHQNNYCTYKFWEK